MCWYASPSQQSTSISSTHCEQLISLYAQFILYFMKTKIPIYCYAKRGNRAPWLQLYMQLNKCIPYTPWLFWNLYACLQIMSCHAATVEYMRPHTLNVQLVSWKESRMPTLNDTSFNSLGRCSSLCCTETCSYTSNHTGEVSVQILLSLSITSIEAIFTCQDYQAQHNLVRRLSSLVTWGYNQHATDWTFCDNCCRLPHESMQPLWTCMRPCSTFSWSNFFIFLSAEHVTSWTYCAGFMRNLQPTFYCMHTVFVYDPLVCQWWCVQKDSLHPCHWLHWMVYILQGIPSSWICIMATCSGFIILNGQIQPM